MGNKKVLSKATRELNKTKRFAAPKNIIEDPRGQWAYPGEITRIPSDKITMQGVPYPVMAYPNMGEPQMMYPGQDYVFPGADYVDEYPQMKKGGTPKSLVKMPKPSKKGLASKKFSRSLEATNKLFTENYLFAKPKSRKRKVFDPNAAYYQEGGISTQEAIDDANNAMMKARLAYAYMHGNPAAQRMVVAPDQPYVFDDGDTGTHFMASMDNYAVPLIQDVNGQLMLGDFGPESAEAMRFDNPDDAQYFAEHYKEVTPDPSYRKEYQIGGAAASPFDLDPKTMKRYLADLKNQENNIKKGYRSGKWYPHPSPEGGLDTIAYGHKLTSRNSPYYQGISDEQAEALLLKDVLQNQALAKKQVDAKFGEGTFDSLPQDRQMLLVDYQYNLGTLAEFPKFVKAVVEGDTKTMIAEHTRYGGKDPLTRRNQWTLNVIDNLTQPIPEKPSNGVTIPLANVPDATNVVLPQIEGGPEGAIELELSPEEIEQYQMGGYIVEDVDATNEVARPCPPGYIFDPKAGRCVPEHAYRLNRAAEKDDINVDDALRENRRYYEGYQFMKDWQNSPMYDKMLKAGARSPESYEYMKKMRQQQLDSTPPLQILPQPEDEPNTGGYSMNATGQIVILPEGFRTRGTHSHELSHSSDRPVRGKRSRLIPQRDVDYVNKNKAKTIADSRAYHNYKDEYDPMFKEYPEYKEQVDDNFKEFSSDYVGEPTEVRARLNAIRQLSKEAGLYDPFTQGVSPDLYYKKLKNYQFEKGDKSGFDPMRQLQDTFSDEEIIWLLNNMSKTEDNKPELNVAQEGGSPDPRTNFYTVEGSGGVYRKVNGRWEVDWNRSGKFQPLSKGDVKKRAAVLDKKAKPLYDATYDDLYATQRSAYTAAPKPTPAKKPTVQDKAAQEQFDKNFQVTGKSKMEVVEDKIQKTADDYAKYHQQQTGKPLTQEEYDDAYQDIYNRAYVDAGVYKPTMSGPTINPYGTTEQRKNLVSLDPGKAPKNLTLGDYVDKGWDVVTNPLDYASYALRPKGTVTTPWNMTNYENRLEAAGLEDPVTANNNVNKAIDFASYFIGPGMVAQGLKMIPGTVNSIGRAFENPSWENTGDALFDAGMTALSVAPGFGIAKNLGKPAATLDDLRAIEALRGNTATTPFQSYYLTGNRALGTSEAAVQQAEALRRFTGQQPLELPAGQYEWFNPKNKELYDNLQQELKELKAVSDELSGFGAKEALDKIDKSKVTNEAFKKLIMGDDLKFKMDDFPDTPRIPVRYAGLEQIRPGGNRISLNAVPETPTPSPRLPRGTAQQNALSDLETLRKQTIMGQDEAFLTFNDLQEQKLKDLNTPEGRRRIQEFIDDNNLKGSYDEGNYLQLEDEYKVKLPEIIKNSDANEINSIIERVKNYQNNRGLMGTRAAKNSGLGSWDELTAADLERIVNPNGINDVILKQTISGSLAKTDPRNTEGFTKLTVDDYIKRIEETQYDDMFMQISGEEMRVKNIGKSLKDKVNERNQLRREYDAGNISQADYKKTQRVLNQDVLDLELQLKNAEASLKNATQYLNRSNANADLLENSINLGNPYTSIGNLEPTMYHEFGHITEGSFIPLNSNSAIDRDLIDNIDLLDEAPEYLFQSIDPNKVLSETAPYNLTSQGIKKYKDPDGYFNSSKEYFLEGGNNFGSMEPTAFAVELRPALKRIGLIKNDFDKVTPEMLEKLYEAYMSNPEFKFLDLRIFDIMKPTEKSFKTLSKNLNKIKGIAPYAIPIGLGVGATGLAGQEEMQQDMEYQDGGIIMELSDDEIQQYANGGFVVEELDYKPDAGKAVNKKTTTSNVGYTPRTTSKPKVTVAPSINLNTEGLSYKPSASLKTQSTTPRPTTSPKPQETLKPKPKPVPEVSVDSMSTILNKYDVSNSSPIMTVDSFQTIINKQEQDRIAKAQKLRKQIEASQRKIEIESTPSYKYPEVMVEGMPNIRTTKSQSFIQGSPLKNEVKKVVLHHTGSTDEKNNNKYVYNHFMNPSSETSAHIVIEEDGQRTIYASPDQVTFHAGKSSWDGRSNVNDFGIGVEFQGDTNVKPLTSAQIKSFVEYFDQLARKYNVSTEDIITHAMVAPGRKPDITDSEYRRILKYLKSRGYK